jgi:hypothetical protein
LYGLFFLKKEPKTLALRGFNSLEFAYVIFREAEPRGLGLAPEKLFKSCRCMVVLLKKEPKTLALWGFSSLEFAYVIFREAEPRGLGLAPEEKLYERRQLMVLYM